MTQTRNAWVYIYAAPDFSDAFVAHVVDVDLVVQIETPGDDVAVGTLGIV